MRRLPTFLGCLALCTTLCACDPLNGINAHPQDRVATPGPASNAYVVSPDGNDMSTGLAGSPWRTLSRASTNFYQPGDTLTLQGGISYSGTLILEGALGLPELPVTVSSDPNNPATIDPGDGSGIILNNPGSVVLQNLHIVGSGAGNTHDGVVLQTSQPVATPPTAWHLNNLTVSGFGGVGIHVSSVLGGSVSDVQITDCIVHDTTLGGITLDAPRTLPGNYAFNGVRIVGNSVYNIAGNANQTTTHTGDGITLSAVQDATLVGNVVHDCGAANACAGAGPVGLGASNAQGVRMAQNESHHIHNGGTGFANGDGFSLANGCSNSTVEYNYAHDNDGAGYHVAGNPTPSQSNLLRYNISQNDTAGVQLSDAGLTWVVNTTLYNNSLVGLEQTGSTDANTTVINSIFDEPARLFTWDSAFMGHFINNDYFSSGPGSLTWGSTAYASVAQWQTASGQELNAGKSTALTVDPGLSNPADGNGFTLTSTSALIDAGASIAPLLGIQPGSRDYYGNAIPAGKAFDVGAAEYGSTPIANQPTALLAMQLQQTHWGRCLDSAEGQWHSDTQAVTYPCGVTNQNQQWMAINGTLQLQAAQACLRTLANSTVTAGTCDSGATHWYVEGTATTPGLIRDLGANDMCLGTLDDSPQSGGSLVVEPCDPTNSNQIWSVVF